MTARAPAIALGLLLIAACAGGATTARAEGPRLPAFLGACYCRAAGALHCTGDLTEKECQRRCEAELCDEWFWKERLPCWNWGYGG